MSEAIKKHRLYIVHWNDAHGVKAEAGLDEVLTVHKPAEYWSTGTLVKSDEMGVTLAQDLGLPLGRDYETTYRSRTFILRVLIIDEFDGGPTIKRKPRPKKSKLCSDCHVEAKGQHTN